MKTAPALRELLIPVHILHAIPPDWDAFLMRLGSLTRPGAWAGMHPDTGWPRPAHASVQALSQRILLSAGWRPG